MQTNIKVGDQVYVKSDQEFILGEVLEEIVQGKYLVDYKQKKRAVHDAQELAVHTPKIQTDNSEQGKRNLRSSGVLIYKKSTPNKNLYSQEDNSKQKGNLSAKKTFSKLQKIQEKKQRKQLEKIVFPRLENNSHQTQNQPSLTRCGQLRMLIDKFNQYVVCSWSNRSYKELITPEEVQKLGTLLSLQTKLQIKQMLDEWLIERFIAIRKDMKQFKLQKYKHIQKLINQRYEQILEDVHSQQFYDLEMRQQRRKYIFAKIDANKLDIYNIKI